MAVKLPGLSMKISVQSIMALALLYLPLKTDGSVLIASSLHGQCIKNLDLSARTGIHLFKISLTVDVEIQNLSAMLKFWMFSFNLIKTISRASGVQTKLKDGKTAETNDDIHIRVAKFGIPV